MDSEIQDRVLGKGKEVTGVATNNRSLEAEGKLDQGKGRLKGWFRRHRQAKDERHGDL